ncbi:hypothetical protein AMECASPLE_036013 [Ameca splendens]|uniref:Uncharacterized protein n=1 Tax=Ameca splendens TaxID=208324 RepID=A0ABV0ZG97_9TELE
MNESTGYTRYTNSDSFVLISVHMIDDRMTLSDPVEEFMSCQQRDISGAVPPLSRLSPSWKRSGHWKGGGFIQAVALWEVRCYPPPFFQKSLYRIFHVVNHGCGSGLWLGHKC